MTTTTKFFAAVTAALLICTGCKSKPTYTSGPDYMILDEVVFVDKFPHSFELSRPTSVSVEILGGLDFEIHDSLMIFATSKEDPMWEFYKLPEFKYLGGYLRKGNGPTEFLQSRWIYKTLFSERHGQFFASFYDFDKGRFLDMDISETLDNGHLSISPKRAVPPQLERLIPLDDDTFFCKELSRTKLTRQNRYLLKGDSRSETDVLAKLNEAYVSPDQDHNILATLTGYNHRSGRIIEAPVMLNYINIYSLDGSFGKTICMDEKLDNIRDIELLERNKRLGTFGSLRVYDDMFGVMSRDNEDGRRSTIWFFDMDGAPLAEFKLDKTTTTFDIDFNEGTLYTHSYESEDFFKYDIREYLGALK